MLTAFAYDALSALCVRFIFGVGALSAGALCQRRGFYGIQCKDTLYMEGAVVIAKISFFKVASQSPAIGSFPDLEQTVISTIPSGFSKFEEGRSS